MKDYIERDKVLKDLLDQCKITGYGGLTPNDIKYVFSLQTNADVRPVVRGRWIVHMSELFPADSTIECDQCHEVQSAFISDSFCPNCGADMRGENK